MNITIPRYTVGTDVETKDVKESSYLLSIGEVLFDNWTLKVIGVFHVTFNPNDPEQAHRTVSDRTMDWWMNRSDPSVFPTQAAYDFTWSGTMGFKQGMDLYAKNLFQMPKDGAVVRAMRGPDFDFPILKSCLRDTQNYRAPLYASPLDSHRTVERVLESLDIPPLTENEITSFWRGGQPIPHVAVYDAGLEGYETARMYHILHLIKTIGYDKAIETVNSWSTKLIDAKCGIGSEEYIPKLSAPEKV